MLIIIFQISLINFGTNEFELNPKNVNHKLIIFRTPKGVNMNKKEDKNKNRKVKDLATEAAIKALIPNEQFPCENADKACTKRWLESQSDCA